MIAVRAARTVIGGLEVRDRWVVVEGSSIVDVRDSPPRGAAELVNFGEVDLLPGLVDLHSDCLELKARPRVSMELPLSEALIDLDLEVVTHGVTTHFLCVCLEDDIGKYRSLARGIETVEVLEELRPHLRADHLVHLRVDVTGDGIPTAAKLARRPSVAILSYMLHLPGLGQFADEATWRQYYTSVEGEGDVAVAERLAKRRGRLADVLDSQSAVASIAHANHAVLASHDDDSLEAVETARSLGVRISEFPVTAEAAAAASEAGIAVLMGAPNARFGRSHHGNLSAREALASGDLAALASDYHPPSLLTSAYSLAEDGLCSWAEAVQLVSTGPAAAAGLTDRGAIAPTLRADLVAVGCRAGRPSVVATWVAGRRVA